MKISCVSSCLPPSVSVVGEAGRLVMTVGMSFTSKRAQRAGNKSSRILLSRSLCASLLPSTGWCSGEEADDDGSSSISPILSAELSSSSLRSSDSRPSSSSSSFSSSSSSPSPSGRLGLAERRSGSSGFVSTSSSSPLPSSAS
ncbi:hypothetical protein EYF80_046205 [Liparis tanakae]|uniref:Uncharacterized protein n=1 Tax=Liparis tanakae TaxID=230148 RepID=A0A4Z2FQR5_9TELE|nr:hypothetical protein EYF80_046205 [Liparis tanakae]